MNKTTFDRIFDVFVRTIIIFASCGLVIPDRQIRPVYTDRQSDDR